MTTSTLLTRILAKLAHILGFSVRVPAPTGPHVVSSLHYRIPNGPYSQIFYPADTKPNTAAATTTRRRSYVRSGVMVGLASFAAVPSWLFHVFMGAAEHNLDGELDPLNVDEKKKRPVLLFMHGLGGNSEVYSSICSYLASFGNIVVVLESEDGSGSYAMTSSGGVVEYQHPPKVAYTHDIVANYRAPFLNKRSQEVMQTLEFLQYVQKEIKNPSHLQERVLSMCDLNNVFLGGHSFGGAATIKTSQDVSSSPSSKVRIKGLFVLDIWSYPLSDASLQRGVNLPYLNILSVPFVRSSEYEFTKQWVQRSTSHGMSWVIPGSVHSSYSDATFWLGGRLMLYFARRLALRGDADPNEVLQTTALMGDLFIKSTVRGDSEMEYKRAMKELAMARGVQEC